MLSQRRRVAAVAEEEQRERRQQDDDKKRKRVRAFRREKRRVRSSMRLYFRVGLVVVAMVAALMYGKLSLFGSGAAAAGGGVDGRRQLLAESSPLDNYPNDLLTKEARENGGIVLHFIGAIYMFIALALVCDEFFVPSLDRITERLDVSPDVAGATFMAAGGSAPELFTSLIGTFISESNVGLGTIVGSAVFNILFVIGACAMAAPGELPLTWWPLARDVAFYSVSLIVLAVFFEDQEVQWWEALIMLSTYALYGIFMRYNAQVEVWVKRRLGSFKRVNPSTGQTEMIEVKSDTTDDEILPPERRMSVREFQQHEERRLSELEASVTGSVDDGGSVRSAKGKERLSFHAGALSAMLHEVDGKGKGSNPEADKRFKRAGQVVMADKSGMLDHADHHTPRTSDEDDSKSQELDVVVAQARKLKEDKEELERSMQSGDEAAAAVSTDLPVASGNVAAGGADDDDGDDDGDDDEEGGLDLTWPTTTWGRVRYVLLMPLTYPMYYTIPDSSSEKWKNWFALSFLMSILWIGAFSFLMVWWTTIIGVVLGIPDAVMGLTFLAAGTSVPDLLTSVIVTRKGYGDMALSSSIGSNIFDVAVGLPLPWILYTAVNQEAIGVGSDALLVSVIVLFVMLMFVIIAIAVAKWRLTKPLGYTMFVFYILFLTQNLLLEYDVI